MTRLIRILPLAPLLSFAACSQDAPAPSEPSQASSSAASARALPPLVEASTAPAATRGDPEALGAEGLGDIVIGKAPPASLKRDDVQISDSCQTFSDKPRRIYAMADGKVVARITAMKGSPVKTAAGIGVGASEADVRKAYPDLAETPHKYVEAPAKYLDWRPGGGTSGIRFEIDGDGKVGTIHAGREPEIEYVEGCA